MDIDEIIDKHLNEGFVNLFSKDTDKMNKYKDVVFSLLQSAYEPIGGIKGSGFGSPEDMVSRIPFWKMSFIDGKLTAVVMYKFFDGHRKFVAMATNKSSEGTRKLKEIVSVELTRSYGEVSGPLLKWMLKVVPDIIEKYKVPSKDVSAILKKPVYIIDEYHYKRKIGDDVFDKILLGTAK